MSHLPSKKFIIFITLILFSLPHSLSASDNAFNTLPYSIVLGKSGIQDLNVPVSCSEVKRIHIPNDETTISLERWNPFNPKVKIKEAKPAPHHTGPCREYVVNKRFFAYLSNDETIYKVEFDPDDLPRKWRNLGIKAGLSIKETRKILLKAGIEKIEMVEDKEEQITRLIFTADSNVYKFRFGNKLYQIDVINIESDY